MAKPNVATWTGWPNCGVARLKLDWLNGMSRFDVKFGNGAPAAGGFKPTTAELLPCDEEVNSAAVSG